LKVEYKKYSTYMQNIEFKKGPIRGNESKREYCKVYPTRLQKLRKGGRKVKFVPNSTR